MGLPDSDIIAAVYHLLPGFISAWIFYGLTAHAKPSPFERVIQALIFTMFAEVLSWCLGKACLLVGELKAFGVWDQDTAFAWKVFLAIALGFVFAGFANTNKFHAKLPDWFTKRTSYPSEWFSAFYRTKAWVYLHLKGERRLYGWPEEWPDAPDKGHFVVMNAEWILDDNETIPLLGIERMIVPASEVELVEFEKDREVIAEIGNDIREAASKIIERNEDDGDHKAARLSHEDVNEENAEHA